jgi:hypothetical protein
MASLLSSRVVIREPNPGPVPIDTVPTNIGAFVGVTEWGPVNEATRIRSFDEFQRIFGRYVTDSELPQAVLAFFLTGGTVCDIVRTVHVTDVTDPATKTSVAATLDLNTAASAPTAATLTGTGVETFSFNPGDTISIGVDGGGAAVATFDATAGFRTSGNSETYALVDSQDILVSVDGAGAQTITFLTAEFAAIGTATAQEVVNVINAKITGASASVAAGPAVTITSDTKGTGSSIEITGGTAAAAFAFPAGAGSGTGDVADISAVTGAEVESVIEADIAGLDVIVTGGGQIRIDSLTTGPTSSLQVAAGAIQIELGLVTATVTGTSGAPVATLQIDGRYDGSRGNDLQIVISAASNGDIDKFDLSVSELGIISSSEIFPNLSLDSLNSRYVETIVNNAVTGSALITVTDLAPAVPDPLPDTGTFGPLTGGDDGLVGLVDADFLGGKSLANGTTGLRSLDTSDAAMLSIPGRASSTVHNGMVDYVENTREGSLFAVLDLPPALEPDGVVTYIRTTAALEELTTYACTFWPRITIDNPDSSFFGTDSTVEVPNSGAVIGRFAKTDDAKPGGVYDYSGGPNNANGTLTGIRGVANTVVFDREARDMIYPIGVNPINAVLGAGGAVESVYLDGTKTLKEEADFERIAKRRGVILIEQSIARGLDPFRHQPNTRALRKTVENVMIQFLQSQLLLGAFVSNVPAEAYQVDVSDAINTPEVIDQKILIAKVRLAMKNPIDFIILEFGPLGNG